MILSDFTVLPCSTLKSAIEKFEKNKYDTVYVVDKCNVLLGVITEGDIRRKIINGVSVHDSLSGHFNPNCVVQEGEYNLEDLLKKFTSEIRSIPIIDGSGVLHNIVRVTDYIFENKNVMTVCSRAPARVSFGGGGSDVTKYFVNQNSQVLSLAIKKYARVVIKPHNCSDILLYSINLGKEKIYTNFDNLDFRGEFRLFDAVFSVIKPKGNFSVTVDTDFRIGSGLGGSSAVCVALIGALNEYNNLGLSHKDIAHLAFQCERLVLGVAGGWQDQYVSVYGGLVNVHFNAQDNKIIPLNINSNLAVKINQHFMLLDTTIQHDSGLIHQAQQNDMNKKSSLELLNENLQLVSDMIHALSDENLILLMDLLHKAWSLKRQVSHQISSPFLDSVYDYGIKSGARGGKLLGAGGGGHFLFGAEPSQAMHLRARLNEKYGNCEHLEVDTTGLHVWRE